MEMKDSEQAKRFILSGLRKQKAGFCSGCRNFDSDKLGENKGYCDKYQMPIGVAKGVCMGVVE